MAREKKLAILAIVVFMVASLTALWSQPLATSYADPLNFNEEALETTVNSDFSLHASNYLLLNFHSSEPFTVDGEEAEEWDGTYSFYANYFGSHQTNVVFRVEGSAPVQLVATGDEGGLQFSVWQQTTLPDLQYRLAVSFAVLALVLAISLIIKDLPPHLPKPTYQSQAPYWT